MPLLLLRKVGKNDSDITSTFKGQQKLRKQTVVGLKFQFSQVCLETTVVGFLHSLSLSVSHAGYRVSLGCIYKSSGENAISEELFLFCYITC